jgi:hypothetical protein
MVLLHIVMYELRFVGTNITSTEFQGSLQDSLIVYFCGYRV